MLGQCLKGEVYDEGYTWIIENVYDLISIIDPATFRYKYLSPSHLKVLGYTPHELLGQNCFEHMHRDDREKFMTILEEGSKRGWGTVQYRSRNREGIYLWLEATGKLIKNQNGNDEILLVTRDITEKKLAEEALKASEARYRLIVDNAYDAISIVDAKKRTAVFINPALEKMLGYSFEEYRNLIIFDLVHPEDRESVMQAVALGLNKGSNTSQFRYRKKDGTYIWIEVNGIVIDSDTGNLQWLFTSRDITEQKLADERLRYSEERYRLIADNSFLMIATKCPFTKKHLYVNATYLDALGYKEDEIIGTGAFDMVHPEDIEKAAKAFDEGVCKGEGYCKYRCRKKDGTYIWVETQGRLVKNATGQVEALFFTRDLSRLQQAEEELRSKEYKLQMITENMLDGIVFINAEKKIEYVGTSFYNIMGYQTSEVQGVIINDNGVHPDDVYKVKSFLENYYNVESQKLELRVLHAGGHYIWLEGVGKAITNNGKFAGWVFGIRDITARKNAEEELHRQLDYRNHLMNNMNEHFYTYDRNLLLTYVNRQTCANMGYSFNELVGRSILEFVHDSDKDLVKNEAVRRLREGDISTYEHKVVTKEGRERLFRIKVSPIFEGHRITGGQVLAEDITDYRKMESEMIRLAQLHTVGEIAAGIGHEIRNPMTTIKGFLQLMSQNPEFYAYRSYFDIMLEELDRANSIISEFLSLAKNKIADLQLRNLNNVINAIFPLLQADAMLDGKTVMLDLQQVPPLMLDEKEIRQLIINLVRNGLEASNPGGRVTIGTYKESGYVIMAVKDQGQGIDSKVKEKLGTPFFTTKERGTGLGLAICHSIARRHNANIQVQSGRWGTIFSVRFKTPSTSLPDIDILADKALHQGFR